MKRCHCPSCRARTERAFWRIIRHNDPAGGWETLTEHAAAHTVVARIGRYSMPPIPTWEGEPAELGDA